MRGKNKQMSRGERKTRQRQHRSEAREKIAFPFQRAQLTDNIHLARHYHRIEVRSVGRNWCAFIFHKYEIHAKEGNRAIESYYGNENSINLRLEIRRNLFSSRQAHFDGYSPSQENFPEMFVSTCDITTCDAFD